ncbi:GtrA family protein [Sulfuricurvum sp.]|uniref:GtrA family protein n=1 Tax=Sulfuricurvum sp. TaxID=2025608 RepID=UPI002E311EAE|nr:GtrA family protein [Sulfuricurvum sp.]HEX5329496.1 GtrA family protein [Sulfuricurvum sp.]
MKQFLTRHEQKIRYLIVGGWNTLFGYGVFAALYFWFGNSMNYLWILSISFVISVANSYLGYKIFVFKTKGNIISESLRVYFVYGVSFVFNLITLPIFKEWLHLNVYLAQALITIITIAGSFILHKKFSFGLK